ncbi:DUF1858 domain-containing protein [Geothrix edaphica]|uniref:DUF1858 domain-containing protein n=1 Tax=Geothrix edaphica TaxID=2927976 RepID=A0ABQ5PYB5_9BACT|nr:DUF1858 domain-containing protein [Geothrix edaphica]GLH67046.1 hypothetical protein GETHED_14100 [Geothrix edaphica]
MAITPETKIGDFLAAHPDQQEALIARVPEFAKLRNPILRRTVAKLATVEHAARMAGLPTAELVRFLRELAGEAAGPVAEGRPAPAEDPRPDWARSGAVRSTLDAEALMAAGEHPLARVRRALLTLAPGEAMQLLSPFRPEPLLDQFRQEGTPCWCEAEGASRFRTWILKT